MVKHSFEKINSYTSKCRKCDLVMKYNGQYTEFFKLGEKLISRPQCTNDNIIEYTHDFLNKKGYSFLMKFCYFGFIDFNNPSGEYPDVIGFRGDYSFVLEIKTSIEDFELDKQKPHRQNTSFGMGDFRFFFTRKNLLTINQLPDGWGLIEIDNDKKIEVIHNPFGKGNDFSTWKRNEKNLKAEWQLMHTALNSIKKNKYKF